MSLASGTKFGPYEIKSPLGAGGMGEVYRALDTRLERTVAIKILPEAFSNDAERLARFQQEARILSALNHPNLLAIYDVGEQNGVRYLVSEFLEGETLRQKLASAPIACWRVIDYALETGKGLAAAHEKGIIHRDLKPDNIFITRDDRVKILDFGLAKQSSEQSADGATLTSPPTLPGTVLGTVGYMSPEQVRGQALDHRSDIFSFGAVLYEMASGQRAFRGESSVETMNAVLKEDVPELSASGTQASAGLERIIRRCLEKKPERRFQSASDLAFALEALSGSSSSSSGASQAAAAISAPMPAAKQSHLPWLVAGLAVLASAALAVWMYTRPRAFDAQFTQISFRAAYIREARFAGSNNVVYGAAIDGKPMQMFSVRTDTLQTEPLNLKADILSVSRGSEMALALDRTFSPLWVPVGRLARAPLGGGATRELLDNVTDADWNPDGSELAIARRVNDKFRIEYPPGKVLYENTGFVTELRFSPKGDRIAFLDHPAFGDDRGTVSVIDLQGHDLKGQRQVMTPEFSTEQGLAWSPKGDEIWFASTLSGELRELRAVDLKGKGRIVLAAPIRLKMQDIAADGRVLLTSEMENWQLGVVETKTNRQSELLSSHWIEGIAPDGSMMLVGDGSRTSANYNVSIFRTDGSPPVKIGEGIGTAFSFDGKWATAIDALDLGKLSVIPTGVGETRTLHAPPGDHYLSAALLPGNKQLLISIQAQGSAQSAVQDLETGAVRTIGPDGRYITNGGGHFLPSPSPDGKYCIETDSENRHWLQPLDGSPASPISGINPGEVVVEWHDDSNNVFVEKLMGSDTEIYTLNLATGQRKLWTRFSPADKTAQIGDTIVIITPDGAHFAYQIQRIFSTLFVADGLR